MKSLLIGTYKYNLDVKGRVVVPPVWRSLGLKSFYLIKIPWALGALKSGDWDAISKGNPQLLRASYKVEAEEGNGRIQIPPELREWLQLEKSSTATWEGFGIFARLTHGGDYPLDLGPLESLLGGQPMVEFQMEIAGPGALGTTLIQARGWVGIREAHILIGSLSMHKGSVILDLSACVGEGLDLIAPHLHRNVRLVSSWMGGFHSLEGALWALAKEK